MATMPPLPRQNPVETPDVVGQYGKVLGLQQMMGAQQLQQQEIQKNQSDLNDRDAMTKAMQAWDGKDPQQLIQSVIKNKGSANAVLGLQQKVLAQREQYSKIAEQDATTGAKNLESMKIKNDTILGSINALKDVPDEELVPRLTQTVQDLVQKGILNPQEAQQAAQIVQVGDPAKIRPALDVFGKLHMSQSQQMEAALKESEKFKNTSQGNEAVAQTDKIKQETQYGPAGPAAEARYRFVLSKLAAHQPVSDQDLTFAKGFEASNKKTTTQSDSLGVTSTNTSAPAGLASVRPAAAGGGAVGNPQSTKDSLVDLFGQYKANPTMLQRMMVKHPDILAAVQQKYPDFDQTTYNAKNKLISNYTSGPQSREINAINTTMGHVKTLDDAIDALNNGNLTLLNKIGTAYNINVAGKTPEAAFKLIANRVGPEIATSYIAGGGGEGERQSIKADFDVNLPPQTLHNNASVTVKMLRSKIGALENQYKNTVGRDDFQQRFITPEAQASLNKFSPQTAAPAQGGQHSDIGFVPLGQK